MWESYAREERYLMGLQHRHCQPPVKHTHEFLTSCPLLTLRSAMWAPVTAYLYLYTNPYFHATLLMNIPQQSIIYKSATFLLYIQTRYLQKKRQLAQHYQASSDLFQVPKKEIGTTRFKSLDLQIDPPCPFLTMVENMLHGSQSRTQLKTRY